MSHTRELRAVAMAAIMKGDTMEAADAASSHFASAQALAQIRIGDALERIAVALERAPVRVTWGNLPRVTWETVPMGPSPVNPPMANAAPLDVEMIERAITSLEPIGPSTRGLQQRALAELRRWKESAK